MNSGATAERVYDALKRRVLLGEFRPGERLDPALLADTLSSSVTPVRDALHQLIGERLVETRTGEGFHRPHLTAPDLQDLYCWAEQVAALAVRSGKGAAHLQTAETSDTADRTACLFEAIAKRSANIEHRLALAAINDRLHAVRVFETRILADVAAELDALELALGGPTGELVRQISQYYRGRRRVASEIVRALYRA